jgi:hypothetical protein
MQMQLSFVAGVNVESYDAASKQCSCLHTACHSYAPPQVMLSLPRLRRGAAARATAVPTPMPGCLLKCRYSRVGRLVGSAAASACASALVPMSVRPLDETFKASSLVSSPTCKAMVPSFSTGSGFCSTKSSVHQRTSFSRFAFACGHWAWSTRGHSANLAFENAIELQAGQAGVQLGSQLLHAFVIGGVGQTKQSQGLQG